MSYVIYTPSADLLKELGVNGFYTEVWRGLPDLAFEETESRGGYRSKRYERGGDYVWVTSDAVEELDENSQAILVASLRKTKSGKIHAWHVSSPSKFMGETPGEITRRAERLNLDSLNEQKEREMERIRPIANRVRARKLDMGL